MESVERPDEVVGPGPVLRDPHRCRPGGSGDLRGDVQQPVAQLLRLRGGQSAVEEQGLGPGEQVDAGQGEFQPCGVDGELP